MNNTFSIGQLAKHARVNIETIRYYERRGLMPEPPRKDSGYRIYTQDSVSRIMFIKHGKDLGFSLKEIEDLLTLRVDPQTTCQDVQRRAETKITDVRERIVSLKRIEAALVKLSSECHGSGPSGDCPILEALEGEHKN